MTAMRVTLIRTDGPGRAAIIKIGHRDYGVRDGFSWSAQHAPGAEFDVKLSAELDGSWPWERMFAANPKRRIDLEPLGGWSYLALGRIMSTDPVRIDCGILIEERAIYTHDARVIGEFVGFRIATLDAEG
jgi:hypothetical protein